MSSGSGIKTEHAGAKNGGGFWGRRVVAKAVSRALRRRADRSAVAEQLASVDCSDCLDRGCWSCRDMCLGCPVCDFDPFTYDAPEPNCEHGIDSFECGLCDGAEREALRRAVESEMYPHEIEFSGEGV